MPVKKTTTEKDVVKSEKSDAVKDVKVVAKKKVVESAGAATTPVVAATTPVAVASASDSVGNDNKDERNSGEIVISELIEKVSALAMNIKGIQISLKQIVKEFDKQKKIVDKVQKKKDKAKKSPSGFAKPCKISDELCEFIGVEKGSELSRTDITRHINTYVKEHNLNNPKNRREFFPDRKLNAILNVKDGENVTYFILQRLIAHHFPPSISKLAAAKAAGAAGASVAPAVATPVA